MSKAFYPRLALSNLKKNGRTYFPFMLTCILTIAMFYIMLSISMDSGLDSMRGGSELRTILGFAGVVIGIFSAIFLFYTNSFLFKRRKKELGLYNILGLGKRHIAKMMLFETLFVTLISLIFGLVSGIVLSRLMFLLLLKIIKFKVVFGFYIAVPAIVITAVLFAAIFFLTLLSNLFHVTLSNPINLLRSGSSGEREPKTKWLLVLAGCVTLGAGYAIALLVEYPLAALFAFLIAVILVMAGTYSLFTAGSIALLKRLRKNKSYYYTPRHFISVSGMIYRMKQNAVGLANICILSCAVLMLFSGSVSLYAGAKDVLRNRYPRDTEIRIYNADAGSAAAVDAVIAGTLGGYEVEISNRLTYRYKILSAYEKDGVFSRDGAVSLGNDNSCRVYMIPLSDFNAFEGKNETLASGEVLVFSTYGDYKKSTAVFSDRIFSVKTELSELAAGKKQQIAVINEYYLIFDSEETITELYRSVNNTQDEDAALNLYSGFDISGREEEIVSFTNALCGRLRAEFEGSSLGVDSMQQSMESFLAVYGGLLFIGIFLGLLFLMAAVLIIYYKQVSEGYEDRLRFGIMQNVGMGAAEIRKTVKSQILLVFFLPLTAAAVHIAFAFKLMTRLLAALGLINIPLTLFCTLGVTAAYALVYAGVYSLTAKTYYKIVK